MIEWFGNNNKPNIDLIIEVIKKKVATGVITYVNFEEKTGLYYFGLKALVDSQDITYAELDVFEDAMDNLWNEIFRKRFKTSNFLVNERPKPIGQSQSSEGLDRKNQPKD